MKTTARPNLDSSQRTANMQVRQARQVPSTASFSDNSARTSSQVQLINAIQSSAPSSSQATQLQRMFGTTAQRAGGDEELQMKSETAQRAGAEDEVQMKGAPGGSAASGSSAGGLPAGLRAGIEATSGMDMSDVQVHSNSAKPKELNALAYTQGNEIHVGPGQEQHLAHEAWHVVQQRQGRVAPTFQAKGVAINDDASLEQEADVMGARAAQAKNDSNWQ